MIEVRDAAGRVYFRAPAQRLDWYARLKGPAAGVRFYTERLYIARPRTRPEWRAWLAVLVITGADVAFAPFFA